MPFFEINWRISEKIGWKDSKIFKGNTVRNQVAISILKESSWVLFLIEKCYPELLGNGIKKRSIMSIIKPIKPMKKFKGKVCKLKLNKLKRKLISKEGNVRGE